MLNFPHGPMLKFSGTVNIGKQQLLVLHFVVEARHYEEFYVLVAFFGLEQVDHGIVDVLPVAMTVSTDGRVSIPRCGRRCIGPAVE